MGMPESFSRLCHSYLSLADRFQQLDVEYMALKARLVPLLRSQKAQQEQIDALTAQNQALSQQLETITAQYEALKSLEAIASPEMQSLLRQAEAQADLVDETIREMDDDSLPGFSPEDKQLLERFQSHPEAFTGPENGQSENGQSENGQSENGHGDYFPEAEPVGEAVGEPH